MVQNYRLIILLKIGGLLALLLPLFQCARIPYLPSQAESLVRIGISQGLDSVEFMPLDPVRLVDNQGRTLFTGGSNQIWRVRTAGTPTEQTDFLLLVTTVDNLAAAKEQANVLRRQRVYVKIQAPGEAGFPVVNPNSYQLWINKKFDSRQDAQYFQQQIQPQTETTVVAQTNAPVTGNLILQNTKSGQEILAASPVRCLHARIIVNDLKFGAGFHWEHSKNQTFRPDLELALDSSGKITLVNVLPLESYLYGTVAQEMNSGFPLEALKAQAITSRTIALFQKGKKHPNALFDYCRTVHCQVYGGMDTEAERIFQAVDATRGQTLTLAGKIIETPYHAVCGGHTENPQNVWSGANPSYLIGKFDVDADIPGLERFDLSQEDKVRTWILSSPKVNCNLTQPDLPDQLNYARKYFRWEIDYTRAELEAIIKSKTNKDIGTLVAIKPLKRGVSGRIIKMAITGSKESLMIEKELEIRRVLSLSHLYSACFIVDAEMAGDGLPALFRIRGAGWGHGVGMCQIGAGMLAQKGWNCQQILNYYYPGTQISQAP